VRNRRLVARDALTPPPAKYLRNRNPPTNERRGFLAEIGESGDFDDLGDPLTLNPQSADFPAGLCLSDKLLSSRRPAGLFAPRLYRAANGRPALPAMPSTLPTAFAAAVAAPLRAHCACAAVSSRPARSSPYARRVRRAPVAVAGGDGVKGGGAEGGTEVPRDENGVPKFRYDPASGKDAFGRDPKKETDFWRGAAAEVIQSEVVQAAVKEFEADGGDGYTEEQREYFKFIESLEAGKGGKEGEGESEGTGGDGKDDKH
jgi:hypothetical protein